ncbi:MAG: hypothetical protein OXF25_02905 [Cyanobacteria bacterium MAG CAR3_bin_5]|nr:hypothetical protein [Cyanobacteria bacterium MAG CAR3_bin_5]
MPSPPSASGPEQGLSLKSQGEREYQPTCRWAHGAGRPPHRWGREGLGRTTTADALLAETTALLHRPRRWIGGPISGHHQRLPIALAATHPFPFPNDASLLPSLAVGSGRTGAAMQRPAAIWTSVRRRLA